MVSMKTRITLLTLGLFTAAVWLLAFQASQELRQGFLDELAVQQSTMVRYIAGSIEDAIAVRTTALKAVASHIRPEWLTDRTAMRDFLQQRLTIQGMFELGLIVIAKDGAGIADYPELPGRAEGSFTDFEYFKEVLATNAPAIDKPRTGRFSQRPVAIVAVPIRDADGGVVGVLAGVNTIVTTDIFQSIRKNTVKQGLDIHVISRRDELFVTSTDPTRTLQPAPSPGINRQHDRYMEGFEGSGVAVNSRGVEELSSAVSIPGTSWFVVAVLPTAAAFGQIARTEHRIYLEAAVVSLLFAALIWLFVHREMAPLGRYAAALRRMTADSEPLQPLPMEGSAEIRQLTASFNRLCLQLRSQEAVLQESESRFRHLADAVPVLIWLADTTKACFYFNKQWLDFTGRSFEQGVVEGWAGCIHPDDLAARRDVYERTFDARLPFAMEYRLRRHDGAYRWLYDHGAPRYDDGGTFLGYVGGCIDITDRKEAETRLLEARSAAEAASRAKSAFLAMMSHELRTPMTGVIGMTDFLAETSLNEDQRSYVDTMRASAKTLLTVLNDILDYSKIDADRLTLDSVTFDVAALAAETLLLFEPKAEENRCSTSLDTGAAGRLIVKGDPIRIKQVLGNLVGNAVKFTRRGTITVRLRHEMEGERIRLRFEIEDTGIGISDADMARLFLPFSQVDARTTRTFGGTGLGLAISKRLVEMMNGEIGASSRAGVGSVFWFSCVVDPGSLPGSLDETAANEPAVAVPPMTILLAEDNPINRMILKVGLERRRHSVTVVENGALACEAAAGTRFDLILMDMQMPVMDGTEATRRIRSLPPPLSDVPIVALTADALAEHRNAYMETGLSDFLTKPVEWAKLDATLARHHRGSKSGAPLAAAQTEVVPENDDAQPLVDKSRLSGIREMMSPPDFNSLVAELTLYSRDEVTRLREATARGDLVKVHRFAHDLKGMFSNLGATRVTTVAKKVLAVNDIEVTKDLLPTLEAAIKDTVSELEQECSCKPCRRR